MAACAEADELVWVGEVGLLFVVVAFKFRDINQQVCGSRFARQRVHSHAGRKTKSEQGAKGKLAGY